MSEPYDVMTATPELRKLNFHERHRAIQDARRAMECVVIRELDEVAAELCAWVKANLPTVIFSVDFYGTEAVKINDVPVYVYNGVHFKVPTCEGVERPDLQPINNFFFVMRMLSGHYQLGSPNPILCCPGATPSHVLAKASAEYAGSLVEAGGALRQWRRSHKWTLGDISRAMECSVSNVSDWENGLAAIPEDLLHTMNLLPGEGLIFNKDEVQGGHLTNQFDGQECRLIKVDIQPGPALWARVRFNDGSEVQCHPRILHKRVG